MGKLSTENLKRLLDCIRNDPTVVVPPLAGFDSGVHMIDDKYLVVSTDPCIGVPKEWFGWLLIHYAASDVALFGAKPQYCAIDLLGPPTTTPDTFLKIMKQACRAADEIGVTIITGHTGSYQGLTTEIGVCTTYGIMSKDKLITPGKAKPCDLILCIKPLGLEVAVNFALTKKEFAKEIFGSKRAEELQEFVTMQSCVKEALILAKTGYVHAMHDTTEGGLTAALNEMAEASKVGFRIDFEQIPFCKEALNLQQRFHLSDEQLLSMSSTGTIVASINPKTDHQIMKTMERNNLTASILGSFEKTKNRILFKKGKATCFPSDADDPYEMILSGEL
jgi:hydrogenase maturation factor